jgi:hypothetical protein
LAFIADTRAKGKNQSSIMSSTILVAPSHPRHDQAARIPNPATPTPKPPNRRLGAPDAKIVPSCAPNNWDSTGGWCFFLHLVLLGRTKTTWEVGASGGTDKSEWAMVLGETKQYPTHFAPYPAHHRAPPSHHRCPTPAALLP